MSDYSTRLRTLLRLTILFCCAANVAAVPHNFTVNDTDSSITYSPPSSWHPSTNLCTGCLNPDVSTSFHEGIHLADAPDADDLKKEQEHEEHEKEEKAAKAKNQGKGSGKRRSLEQRVDSLRRDDTDDGAPPPPDVQIAFNFTGSSFYVSGILPPPGQIVNSTSSNTNLTFLLDGADLGTNPQPTSGQVRVFLPSQSVFSKTGLSEAPHSLVIKLGSNSTFIFQSITYTRDVPESAIPPSPSGSSPQAPSTPASTSIQSSPSTTTEPENTKHNVATFAGAVGGGVGVLALFSFGLALSIIIRRRKSIRRDRADHESLHTNASDDSPAMSGPAPFIPRYFPDTVIPTEPPTYNTALATGPEHSTLLTRLTPAALMAEPDEEEEDRSYANVPPAMPPPPVDDLASILMRPPPSFEATTAPPPPPPGIFIQRPEGALLTPIMPGVAAPAYESNAPPSAAGDVGTAARASVASPEQVPLLQAVDATESIPPPVVPESRAQTPAPVSSSASSMYVSEPPDLPESRTRPSDNAS